MFETPTQTPISPVPPPVIRAKSSSRLGTGILALAALVAIGGIAFAGGRLTAPAAAATTAGTTGRQGFGFNGGAGASAGNGGGTGFANRLGGENGGVTLQGTVTAISSSSLSLKLANGTTVTIPIDSSTTYHRQQAATSTDVASGATVLVEVSGFGGRAGGTAGTGGGAGSSPAAGSFAPPSFDPNASPNPDRVSGQLTFGTARDITIAAQ